MALFMRDIDRTRLCTSETLAMRCLETPLAPPSGSATECSIAIDYIILALSHTTLSSQFLEIWQNDMCILASYCGSGQ